MDSTKVSSPETSRKRLSRLLTLIGVIFGTPIAAVALHLYAEEHYPTISRQTGMLLLIGWGAIHFFYMAMLHDSLEAKIADLVSAENGNQEASTSKTAGAISLAVVSGLTLVLLLLLFNFYAHESAAKNSAISEQIKKEQFDKITDVLLRNTASNESEISSFSEQKSPPVPVENTNNNKPGFLEISGSFLGTFGDFFGGIVNPLLTAGTLVALAITILLQRTQLDVAEHNTKKQSALTEKQAFETTFFNMLGLHNSTVQDLKFDSKSVQIPIWLNDRDYQNRKKQEPITDIESSKSKPLAEYEDYKEFDDTEYTEQEIEDFYNVDMYEEHSLDEDLFEEFIQDNIDEAEEIYASEETYDISDYLNEGYEDGAYDYYGEPDYLVAPVKLPHAEGREVFARVLELMDSKEHTSTPLAVYHRIQKHHNYVLGHYFRTLYQVLELVDEYSNTTDHETATRYSSIIRAQLSANELIVLFYNCGYSLVDSGEFRKLLKRYEILEHMPLHFSKNSKILSVPGYSFDLRKHARQYLASLEDSHEKDSKGGAFGENPAIHEYLINSQ